MKAKDIVVGRKYIGKVGVNVTVVRVDKINKDIIKGYSMGGRKYGVNYSVTNLKTGRQTVFNTASKFRREATPEEVRKASGLPAEPKPAPARPAVTPDGDTDFDTGPTKSHNPEYLKTIQGGYGTKPETPAPLPEKTPEPTFVVVSLRRTGTPGGFSEMLYLIAACEGRWPSHWTSDPTAASRFRGQKNYMEAVEYTKNAEKFGLVCFIHCEYYGK
jgi:hypothetical protein